MGNRSRGQFIQEESEISGILKEQKAKLYLYNEKYSRNKREKCVSVGVKEIGGTSGRMRGTEQQRN